MDNGKQQLENDIKRMQQQEDDFYKDLRDEALEGDTVGDSDDNYDLPSLNATPTVDEQIVYPDLYNSPVDAEFEAAQESFPELHPEDMPIFDGGPLMSELNSWKQQYNTVFVTEVLGKVFISRSLNRHEYKQLIAMPNTDGLMREEIICATTTLWPGTYDWRTMATGDAGVPSTLASVVMQRSGFTQEYNVEVL